MIQLPPAGLQLDVDGKVEATDDEPVYDEADERATDEEPVDEEPVDEKPIDEEPPPV